MLPTEVMQNSTGESNDHDYLLNFPTSQASQFYSSVLSNASNQSTIPGLLRLVNSPQMGVATTSPGTLQATPRQGYGPSGLKRSAHEPRFTEQAKCESLSDSEKYASSHASLSPQVAHSKSSSNSLHGPMKKTKGRVKIKMEFIDNKLRRYTTFSKRKTGIMKKAYELSTLTGTQVMLLVASETGHVYTFATRKLQPMITSEAGKALIQTCLNSPDPSPTAHGMGPGPIAGGAGLLSTGPAGAGGSTLSCNDQRMSATGFEETDLCYSIDTGDDEHKDFVVDVSDDADDDVDDDDDDDEGNE